MNYENYINKNNPEVTIRISNYGDITLELFFDVAPNTIKNFIHHINNKYYDGLIFHRIISGFMIQGGWGKKQVCQIKGEFSSNGITNPLKHHRGVISMARTSDPNSQTTQFFIMHQDGPHLDGHYAAFGGITSGFEVLDQIAQVKTDHQDKPLEDIIIESITIDTKSITYDMPQCYSYKV